MKLLLVSLVPLALMALPALATEKRKLDAHEHGVSKVQIAVEGGVIDVTLEAPGVDIVGFEHPASSKKDKAAVQAALEKLEQADAIVVPDAAAGCKLKEAHAQLHGDGEHEDHDKHAKDDKDHKHEHKHEHKDDHKDDDHAKHEKHAKEKASHTEFEAHYQFDCAKPDALKSVSFPFFKSFKNASEIEVQYVTSKGAGADELTPDKATLSLK